MTKEVKIIVVLSILLGLLGLVSVYTNFYSARCWTQRGLKVYPDGTASQYQNEVILCEEKL
jgi:hypothetical protein